MERYIDAKNAKSYIWGQFVDRIPQDILDAVVRGVDDIEFEDVMPVVHAHWIEEDEPYKVVFEFNNGVKMHELYIDVKCSNCRRYTGFVYSSYLACIHEYCKHCGAKMDEEVE